MGLDYMLLRDAAFRNLKGSFKTKISTLRSGHTYRVMLHQDLIIVNSLVLVHICMNKLNYYAMINDCVRAHVRECVAVSAGNSRCRRR